MTAPHTHQDLGLTCYCITAEQVDPIRHKDDPENLQCHAMSNYSGLMVFNPVISWLTAWAAKTPAYGKRLEKMAANQGNGFTSETSSWPSPPNSGKHLVGLIGNMVTHDVVCRSSQLMGQCSVGDHTVCPGHFSIKENFCFLVHPASMFCSF